jgi:hypothetical protein
MVTRAVWLLYPLILAVAVTLAGCTTSLGTAAEAEGVSADAVVSLAGSYAIAARRSGDAVEVVAFRADGDGSWSSQTMASDRGGDMSAHLVAQDGETGEAWNSLFYGTAPDGASRVVVDGFAGQGGQVTDGAWAIAFRQTGLTPDQLRWRVLDATGTVLERGTGITP